MTECFKSNVNHDENCFVFKKDVNQCHTCKKGFAKNHDGRCEKLVSGYCLEEGNILKTFNDNEYNLALYKGAQGCIRCQDGYTRLFKKLDDYVCISSSYSINPIADATNYITNCEYYQAKFGNSGKLLLCSRCS